MQQEQFTKIINERYNTLDFDKLKKNDPVSVVHKMYDKSDSTLADVEICALITAMFCWESSPQKAIDTATKIMDMANWDIAMYVKYGEFYNIPDEQVISKMLKAKKFKAVLHNIRQVYSERFSMQETIYNTFSSSIYTEDKAFKVLLYDLCKIYEPARLGSPERNSACSRINTLLRWMIRKKDIDLGIWQMENLKPSMLKAILDCKISHIVCANNFLDNNHFTWKGVEELTYKMKIVDACDPLKCDIVLRSMDSIWLK